jgi:plastocyanin
VATRSGSAVLGVLVLGVAAAVLIGNCGGSTSSPSPIASATPTPTPAPLTPLTPVPVAPQPTPSPGGPNPTPTPTTPPSSITITIVGLMGYSPNPANVRVGQQIFWHNADTIVPPGHTATNHGAGGFNTGLIAPGGTSSVPITMSTPGTFTYICDIHTSMVGTLNVTP